MKKGKILIVGLIALLMVGGFILASCEALGGCGGAARGSCYVNSSSSSKCGRAGCSVSSTSSCDC